MLCHSLEYAKSAEEISFETAADAAEHRRMWLEDCANAVLRGTNAQRANTHAAGLATQLEKGLRKNGLQSLFQIPVKSIQVSPL